MNIENESYGQGQNFPGTCVDKEVIEKDKKQQEKFQCTGKDLCKKRKCKWGLLA